MSFCGNDDIYRGLFKTREKKKSKAKQTSIDFTNLTALGKTDTPLL
jgi:hypothetical protein